MIKDLDGNDRVFDEIPRTFWLIGPTTISFLIDLDAKSALEFIRQGFNRDIVFLGVTGDLENVEIELGLREKRGTEMPFNNMRSLRKARESERTAKVKIGRNELCPCGSGKKYKKCCMP